MFDFSKYDAGGAYISASEKAALADTGAPFNIVGVIEREGKFESKREYLVKIIIPEGVEGVEAGERSLTFAKGSGADSRDALLEGMMGYFDGDDADEIPAKLVKVGRAWLIKAAS